MNNNMLSRGAAGTAPYIVLVATAVITIPSVPVIPPVVSAVIPPVVSAVIPSVIAAVAVTAARRTRWTNKASEAIKIIRHGKFSFSNRIWQKMTRGDIIRTEQVLLFLLFEILRNSSHHLQSWENSCLFHVKMIECH